MSEEELKALLDALPEELQEPQRKWVLLLLREVERTTRDRAVNIVFSAANRINNREGAA